MFYLAIFRPVGLQVLLPLLTHNWMVANLWQVNDRKSYWKILFGPQIFKWQIST
jgi:hypothetical protein